MKLWGGRFSKSTDSMVDDFNSSIRFDQRLYKEDILGSIAHVSMLGKQNIIPQEDAEIIKKELKAILQDIEDGKIEFDIEAEDIHMNIEKILISRIGDTGKKLHTGRSRNDQVALDMRMYVKKEIKEIQSLILKLQSVLIKLSKEHAETIMPGYTHLQRAQPITLAHHLMAYFEMFKRDIERLNDTYKRTNILPLGSGALAATTYPLDRYAVAKDLGFSDVTFNSLDGVSDRDYCIELLNNLSLIMMHLSRFSEEIILWSSHEFHFIELDDAYSTGSSIMPQKKNPDIAELVRGKTGRVYGDLMSLLTTMKSLPLAYNKDMQEDKEVVFDAIDTVKMCLPIFTSMIETMKVLKDNMYNAAGGGFTNATDAADYLVKKGLPFRDAHEIIGKLVLYCIQHNTSLEKLSLEEYKQLSPAFDEDIFKAISLEECVNKRKIIGGPAKEMVLQHIQKAEEYINSINTSND
ncbi:MAG: argininosuccinate lyase [Epulopiscium sp.]|jgi:argininosuccinate lyase|uniref:argininosuccinate lyase n=1 Tax=Defluviitalea raffinosedens TaxID=1450156 RepID=UPI00175A7F43|nr:argininosuccinate lyase [Defluviitalea raffinosedens]MBM7685641.1 argininosuccinate lyase [Defluviitalea raffinosedens]MDK2789432.1 argininosuccinate lyase [Candidatus Epulonipiscium sp.]HHW66630.1 argininosuccinate lyase [Candidatus Epulonipiscium sp.]